MTNVTIIGSGNLAEALCGAIYAADGVHVTQVCARDHVRGRSLATRYGALYARHPEDAAPADLYIIAVSDSAIEEVSSRLKVPEGAVVAHVSGGRTIGALQCATPDKAVFYPLQTFSAGRPADFREIPVFIEYSTANAGERLRTFADALSCKVAEADGELRNKLHVAAVFACNFTNHLYALAGHLLAGGGPGFHVLKPLIRETAEKAIASYDPASVQTGPAVRNDKVTLLRHLEILGAENEKRYKEIYKLLSESIWETSKKT